MQECKIAVIGATGAVGRVFLNILEERHFPATSIRLCGKNSVGTAFEVMGENITVEEVTPKLLSEVDLAFISATTSVSKEVAPMAAAQGAVVIDDSSAFRMDSEVPLVVVDHKPVAVLGVVPNGDVGFVWLMATPDLQKIGVPFLRECMRVVQLYNDRYLVLSNFVDARNKLHIRWLRWCGFKFINKHKRYGVAQIPFYEFARIK